MSPRDGAEAIRMIIGGAEHVTVEPPRSLMRELPPADPYPIDALEDLPGAVSRAINDRVQAPLAICGSSVLGAATLVTQGHADVVLPIGVGQSRPLSLYLVTIASSGERKSAADYEAMWPIRCHEATLREQYATEKLRYDNDRAAWDQARSVAVKAGKGDRALIRTALDELGPPPDPPPPAMLTCPEPTFEGLSKLYAISLPSMGVFAAEGGQFIAGHARKDEAKLCTAAGLSSLWDGEGIRRVRSGDGAVILPGTRLSMHLMAQPAVADIWLRDQMLTDQGILSRCLMSAPDSAMGSRMSRADGESSETAASMARYGARLPSIHEMPLPLAGNRANGLAPRQLPLSVDARKLWTTFGDHIETMLVPDGEMRPISGLANKLAEHATRIAGVLTLVRNVEAARSLALKWPPPSSSRNTMRPKRCDCTPGAGSRPICGSRSARSAGCSGSGPSRRYLCLTSTSVAPPQSAKRQQRGRSSRSWKITGGWCGTARHSGGRGTPARRLDDRAGAMVSAFRRFDPYAVLTRAQTEPGASAKTTKAANVPDLARRL